MASAHDVARYILEQRGPMTAMKLQKLVYYSQAWHLTWDEEPLFGETVQAWANGPVVYELYDVHRGDFRVSSWPRGDSSELTKSQRESIDEVLKTYGGMSALELSELTHSEDPWREARVGLSPGDRSNRTISHASMAEYYLGLVAGA